MKRKYFGRYAATRYTAPSKVARRRGSFTTNRNVAGKLLSRGVQAASRAYPLATRAYRAGKTAYNVGRYVYKNARARGTQTSAGSGPAARSSGRSRRNWVGTATGTYKGRFPKTKKIKRTVEQMCLSRGYHKTIEQFGTVSDPDSLYITQSTTSPEETASVIAAALMRTVMSKAGFKITNQFNYVEASDPTPGSGAAGFGSFQESQGLRFEFVVKNALVSTFTTYLYDTTSNQNFLSMVGAFTDLPYKLIDYFRNVSAEEPYKLAVFKKDTNGGFADHWRLGAEMYLEDAHLEIFYHSNLCLQNRTKAAEAGGADYNVDRIDNQPLKGWIYDFKHADPRVRHTGTVIGLTDNNIIFNRIPSDGLQLIRGAMYDGAREPFVPKYFSNVKKAVPILLQPGDMKKTGFTYKFSGTFTNVVRKIRAVRWFAFGGLNHYSGVIGKSQMIALEEVMRTPSSNKITIAFEREIKIGCIVKSRFHQAPLESLVVSQQKDENANA